MNKYNTRTYSNKCLKKDYSQTKIVGLGQIFANKRPRYSTSYHLRADVPKVGQLKIYH